MTFLQLFYVTFRCLSTRERREDELRDAYRRARSPEEASAILQRYAQRFSISEAVLERLQLPKLLDRSISADPSFPCSSYPLSLSLSASPTTPDPFDMDLNGPMRYLRQQSAPAPKFTSRLEARVEEFPKDSAHQRPQIRSRSSEPPATRGLSPKPVPLLMPKPYLQSRPTAAEELPNKVRLSLKQSWPSAVIGCSSYLQHPLTVGSFQISADSRTLFRFLVIISLVTNT